jgi:hypothetical protein
MKTKGMWFSLFFAPWLAGGQVVDQQNTSIGTDAFMVESTEFLGQGFRPSVDGNLTGVDLMLARNMSRSGILNLEIRSLTTEGTDSSYATVGPALFSHGYSFDSIGADFSLVHFPISTEPLLAAGQPYVILLTSSEPSVTGGIDPVAWLHSADPYLFGSGYIDFSGRTPSTPGWYRLGAIDFGFQTYMDVPEPSTLSLALGSFIILGAAGVRRCRRTVRVMK